jgi:hypothetical protein
MAHISRNHTTAIAPARKLSDALLRSGLVTKIAYGFITPTRGGAPSERKVKIRPIPAGFTLTMRSSTSVQEMYVYAPTAQHAAIWKLIEEECGATILY